MKKLFFLIISLMILSFGLAGETRAGVDDNVSGWAWSSNIGWIHFAPAGPCLSVSDTDRIATEIPTDCYSCKQRN